jgi:hypothetical protein
MYTLQKCPELISSGASPPVEEEAATTMPRADGLGNLVLRG